MPLPYLPPGPLRLVIGAVFVDPAAPAAGAPGSGFPVRPVELVRVPSPELPSLSLLDFPPSVSHAAMLRAATAVMRMDKNFMIWMSETANRELRTENRELRSYLRAAPDTPYVHPVPVDPLVPAPIPAPRIVLPLSRVPPPAPVPPWPVVQPDVGPATAPGPLFVVRGVPSVSQDTRQRAATGARRERNVFIGSEVRGFYRRAPSW